MVSVARLLALILILGVAVAGTLYLAYPSVPHVASQLGIGSSTLTSTYVSFSSYLTQAVVSATITSETCQTRKDESRCTARTLVTSSYSSFTTTEQVLSTQFERLITYSYTTSRTEITPPYAYLGLSEFAFTIVTIAESGVLACAFIFLFLRRPGPAKQRIGPVQVRPPVQPMEPAPPPKDHDTIKSPNLVPIATLMLIALNVLFFILEEAGGGSQNRSVLIQMGAVTSSTLAQGEYFRLIFASFLHIGSSHLLSNMYALLFIGWALERVYGHVRFAVVYFLSGIVGSVLSAITIPIGVVAAGASGAILGCLVALIILQSRFSHVSFGLGLGSAVLSLLYNLFIGLMPGSGIDNAAHFGGAIGGLLLSLIVPPPSEFFSHIKKQTKPSLKEDSGQDIHSAQLLEEQATTQVAQSSRQKQFGRTLLIAALVFTVLLGGLTFVLYPRLQISDVRLSLSYSSSVSGTVTIEISGQGIFALQHLTVTLSGNPLSVSSGYSGRTYVLPQQFSLYVTGPGSFALYSALVVTVDGTWGPGGSPPFIPVLITAQETIQWSYP